MTYNITVTFFTKPNCPACVKTKQLLDDNGISYDQVNVANKEGYMELLEMCDNLEMNMPKASPVVIIGSDIWSGDDFYIDVVEGIYDITDIGGTND